MPDFSPDLPSSPAPSLTSFASAFSMPDVGSGASVASMAGAASRPAASVPSFVTANGNLNATGSAWNTATFSTEPVTGEPRFGQEILAVRAETAALLDALASAGYDPYGLRMASDRADQLLLARLEKALAHLQEGRIEEVLRETRGLSRHRTNLLYDADRYKVSADAFEASWSRLTESRMRLLACEAQKTTGRPSTGVLESIAHYENLLTSLAYTPRLIQIGSRTRHDTLFSEFQVFEDTPFCRQGVREYFAHSPGRHIQLIEDAPERSWRQSLQERLDALPDGVHCLAIRIVTLHGPDFRSLRMANEKTGHVDGVIVRKQGAQIHAVIPEGGKDAAGMVTALKEMIGGDNVLVGDRPLQNMVGGCKNLVRRVLTAFADTGSDFEELIRKKVTTPEGLQVTLPPGLARMGQTQIAWKTLDSRLQGENGYDNVRLRNCEKYGTPDYRFVNLAVPLDSMRAMMMQHLGALHRDGESGAVVAMLARIHAFDAGFDDYFIRTRQADRDFDGYVQRQADAVGMRPDAVKLQ